MAVSKKKKSALDEVVDLFNDVFYKEQEDVTGLPQKGASQTDGLQNDGVGEGCIDLNLDGFSLFGDTETDARAESAMDGLVLSLNTCGKVDVEYIAEITNKTVKEVVNAFQLG